MWNFKRVLVPLGAITLYNQHGSWQTKKLPLQILGSFKQNDQAMSASFPKKQAVIHLFNFCFYGK